MDTIDTRDVEEFVQRFVVEEGGCWMWTRGKGHGYGYFSFRGKRWRAHRFAYEVAVGPIPGNLDLDHLCHNADESCPGGDDCAHRACVNPDHLEPATRKQNVLRGRALTAANAKATACPEGHEYDAENTYWYASKRQCKRCRSRRSSEQWLARKR